MSYWLFLSQSALRRNIFVERVSYLRYLYAYFGQKNSPELITRGYNGYPAMPLLNLFSSFLLILF